MWLAVSVNDGDTKQQALKIMKELDTFLEVPESYETTSTGGTGNCIPGYVVLDRKLRMPIQSLRTACLKLKSVVEEVLNLHFGEIELVVVLKSLHVGKYFDKILGNMPLPQ